MKDLFKQLTNARTASLKAISQFITTEEILVKQNETIAATLDQAELEIQKLQELKANGLKVHEENSGIIERIGQIVRGTEVSR